MEFKDVLTRRHSVRAFKDKPIEKEKLKAIIAAAISAPSAGNLQAYKLYVVHTPEAREALMIACAEQEFIKQAPVVLVFCGDVTRSAEKYEERGAGLYAYQDATIACAYAQLSATEEGLGACWVGAFEPLEVARVVNAGAYEIPIAVLPIGYPAEKPERTSRRLPEEIISEV